jgi:hypothetical protein
VKNDAVRLVSKAAKAISRSISKWSYNTAMRPFVKKKQKNQKTLQREPLPCSQGTSYFRYGTHQELRPIESP